MLLYRKIRPVRRRGLGAIYCLLAAPLALGLLRPAPATAQPLADAYPSVPSNEARANSNSLRLMPPLAVAQADMQPNRNPGAAGDPTVPGPRIREALEADPNKHQGDAPGNAQRGAPGQPTIPDIHLKARVLVRGAAPVAVLEIGTNRLTVTVGTQITIVAPNEGPSDFHLKVANVTVNEVRLELMHRDQLIRFIQLN